MGINAFVLDYRAGTDDAADKSEEDLHRAIQFIFENKERFQLEDSYAVVGFSAGGHLTAEFGTDNRGYKTALERYGARLSIDSEINKYITVGGVLDYTYSSRTDKY